MSNVKLLAIVGTINAAVAVLALVAVVHLVLPALGY